MMKNALLIAAITLTTLLAALGMIRWYAPHLLGIPVDLQMVRVSTEVVPFFDSVFRPTDYAEDTRMIISDPHMHRAQPLYEDRETMGPHDILGFRNRHIPNVADIITIGDSQTYGNNVPIEQSWPGQLRIALGCKSPVIYNMSVGGWGAVEYLQIFRKALLFQPRVIVVAFYTGNDPMDSFIKAYSDDTWKSLRPNNKLDKSDTPPHPGFPPPADELWNVRFADESEFLFAPSLRLASNAPGHPAVAAGYQIILSVAELMQQIAASRDIRLVFSVIPTTELVYAERVKHEQLQAPDNYQRLVASETRFILELQRQLSSLPGVDYIDVLTPLQQAALRGEPLYPPNNGHPLATGYATIAQAMAPLIERSITATPQGMVAVPEPSGGESSYAVYLVTETAQQLSNPGELMHTNGWTTEDLNIISARDLATMPRGPSITASSPGQYTPAVVNELIAEQRAGCESKGTSD